MTEKEIAAQAWEKQSSKRWHELEADPKAFGDPFIQGISDFKQALKRDIESRIDLYTEARSKELEGTIPYFVGTQIIGELSQVLELLDTCKP